MIKHNNHHDFSKLQSNIIILKEYIELCWWCFDEAHSPLNYLLLHTAKVQCDLKVLQYHDNIFKISYLTEVTTGYLYCLLNNETWMKYFSKSTYLIIWNYALKQAFLLFPFSQKKN